jgi:uncharacterized protein (TIGR02266 family)
MDDSERKPAKVKILLRLIRLIFMMSTEQQVWLLKRLGTFEDIDARRHLRKPCAIRVYYAVGDRYFRDTIQNISIGGVFIETRKPFGVGQEVLLTFSLPSQASPFSLLGEVAWTGANGIGVRFRDLTDDQSKILNMLLQI